MKKYISIVLLVVTAAFGKQAVDYDGTPLSKNGGITITSQTLPAILSSYTQAINFDGLLDYTFGSFGIKTKSLYEN
jgi:hypothetical protein